MLPGHIVDPNLCWHHDQRAIVIEPCQERHNQITSARSAAGGGAVTYRVQWVEMMRHMGPKYTTIYDPRQIHTNPFLLIFNIHPLNPGVGTVRLGDPYVDGLQNQDFSRAK